MRDANHQPVLYVVQVHRPLQDPLASMVVASALTVDTALKQDERGFG